MAHSTGSARHWHVSLRATWLMLQYGEFRQGFNKDKADTRIVAYGMRYLVENYVAKPWALEDVDMAEAFYK